MIKIEDKVEYVSSSPLHKLYKDLTLEVKEITAELVLVISRERKIGWWEYKYNLIEEGGQLELPIEY